MYTRSGEWVIISKVSKYIKADMLKSLRFRIALLVIVVGFCSGALMRAVILNSYEKRAVEVQTAEIQNQCTILCNQLRTLDYSDGITSEVIKGELTQLSNIYSGRVMVIDSEYRIVEDTYDMDKGKTIVSEDVIRCKNGNSTSRYDAENRYIEVASPIMAMDSDEVSGVILVSISTDPIVEGRQILENKADILGMAMGLVTIITALFLGFVMVKPFGRITHSIAAVTEGYNADYLHENSYTETRLLSEAFNKMLGRLKILDDSRQEFVSNVSHELKTPITSMKVLADSLLLQDDVPVELYKEFMEDLSEEIEREAKIINDLLSLVKMDKTANTMNIRSENMNELVEKILKRLRPIAAANNIEVVYESFRPVTAEVDETKFSLALSNLVENAIKYNRKDGTVMVSALREKNEVVLTVSDTGNGIDEAFREQIFEPFFRVDKSRSRELGGVGLGLAMVREVVRVHDGTIEVYTNKHLGTTFEVKMSIGAEKTV